MQKQNKIDITWRYLLEEKLAVYRTMLFSVTLDSSFLLLRAILGKLHHIAMEWIQPHGLDGIVLPILSHTFDITTLLAVVFFIYIDVKNAILKIQQLKAAKPKSKKELSSDNKSDKSGGEK